MTGAVPRVRSTLSLTLSPCRARGQKVTPILILFILSIDVQCFPAGDGGFDGGAGEEGVVEHVGELGEDGALVEGVVLAPVELALLDVFLGGHAGYAAVLAGEVGGVVDGDGDARVDVALGVVGVEELAVTGEGVAGEEHAGGVEALEGLHLVLGHGVGLGDDDEELRGVEALEVVRLVGGEADGVAVVGEVPL